MIPRRTAILLLMLSTPLSAAVLTHGPMAGHTTHDSVRVWIRADRECIFQLRLDPVDGGDAIFSESVSLEGKHNFCGSVALHALDSETTYAYGVILDGKPLEATVRQQLTTFPRPNAPGVARIGFGHSLIGPKDQVIWRAIEAKKPQAFILMGDNIYSNTTDPAKQRRMYLQFRADPHFRRFAAVTPIYAIWDDHDFGKNNSDRTQPGKERSLATFNELWPNPPSQAVATPGIWTRFSIGSAEFFLLDVRYHRSPDDDPDNAQKTMLGIEQRDWLADALAKSQAVFKFPVSGSSWNCGGVEAWNHRYTHEYDWLLSHVARRHIGGIILLGGDQHCCKIAVRPGESWGGYDLHEWMAGQLWNTEATRRELRMHRGFGLITLDTRSDPATAKLEFFGEHGDPLSGRRILYTTPGALRAFWNSPPHATVEPPRSVDGELRPTTSGPLWESLPATTGEMLTEKDLQQPLP